MKNSVLSSLAVICALAFVLTSPARSAAVDASAKCEFARLKAAGKNLACLLNQRGKGLKRSSPPNYRRCGDELQKKFGNAEEKFSEDCPVRGWLGGTVRFVNNGDGTITDNLTNLMWEMKDDNGGANDNDNTYTWAGFCAGSDDPCQPNQDAANLCLADRNGGAPEQCSVCPEGIPCNTGTYGGLDTIWSWLKGINGAAYAGHSDWRLPTTGELMTILAEPSGRNGCTVGPPCVHGVFDDAVDSFTRGGDYWSGTIPPPPDDYAGECVAFDHGFACKATTTDDQFVRAVRTVP